MAQDVTLDLGHPWTILHCPGGSMMIYVHVQDLSIRPGSLGPVLPHLATS